MGHEAGHRVPLIAALLLGLTAPGCVSGPHPVRSVVIRTADGKPRARPAVAVTNEQVERAVKALARKVAPAADPLEAARERFEVPVRGGAYVFDGRTKQLRPLGDAAGAEAPPPELVEQARGYLRWCGNVHQPGDCLQLLRSGGILDAHGRYAVAMAIAQGTTIEATRDSLKGMANPQAVMGMVVSGMTMYLMLWVLPEPVSKGIAAAVTVVLVAYLGVDTLFTLGRGWKALVERADAATTFDQLREAGEAFGKVMGADTARLLVMLATAAMGSGAAGLAKIAPTLPGAAQASRLAVAEGGVALEAVGAVESVTIAESGLTIALAPGAMAMASAPMPSGQGGQRYKNVELVDARGAPVGELDEIADGQFFEDKSAEGLGRINPKTGAPAQTPDEWAETQIYEKTVKRLENLSGKAAATRAAPGSAAPTLQELSGIRRLTFRLRSASPEVVSAVNRQLARLTARFPGWTFDAIYGVH